MSKSLGPTQIKVLGILQASPVNVATIAEITTEVDLSFDAVAGALRRLQARGLVDPAAKPHRGIHTYWRLV